MAGGASERDSAPRRGRDPAAHSGSGESALDLGTAPARSRGAIIAQDHIVIARRGNGEMSLEEARNIFELEAGAIRALSQRLDSRFNLVVDMILACSGRIILFGVGKSGHIARKIAATMASLGICAFFVHAGECHHGDIGSIGPNDLVVAISYGGESSEVLTMLPVIKHIGAQLVAITGKLDSTLGRHADVVLDIGPDLGEGLHGWTHLSSLAASMAMGDALAIATGLAKGVTKEDFARYHPGGSFGKEQRGQRAGCTFPAQYRLGTNTSRLHAAQKAPPLDPADPHGRNQLQSARVGPARNW